MTILLNGDAAEVGEARNISQLAERYGLNARTALIEHNGLALRPREWVERELAEGDRIEVVRVVAGG